MPIMSGHLETDRQTDRHYDETGPCCLSDIKK